MCGRGDTTWRRRAPADTRRRVNVGGSLYGASDGNIRRKRRLAVFRRGRTIVSTRDEIAVIIDKLNAVHRELPETGKSIPGAVFRQRRTCIRSGHDARSSSSVCLRSMRS